MNRDKTLRKMEHVGEVWQTRVGELLGSLEPESREIPVEMPEPFRSAWRRAAMVRRASLAAKRRSRGASSFGRAVWMWLDESLESQGTLLLDATVLAQLHSETVRAVEFRPEALSAICRSGRLDPFEFVRTIACARITMPRAMVRLSAGRQDMNEAIQALSFLAGANSIFYGDRLLTTGNPDVEADRALFSRLGIRPMPIGTGAGAQEERGGTASS